MASAAAKNAQEPFPSTQASCRDDVKINELADHPAADLLDRAKVWSHSPSSMPPNPHAREAVRYARKSWRPSARSSGRMPPTHDPRHRPPRLGLRLPASWRTSCPAVNLGNCRAWSRSVIRPPGDQRVRRLWPSRVRDGARHKASLTRHLAPLRATRTVRAIARQRAPTLRPRRPSSRPWIRGPRPLVAPNQGPRNDARNATTNRSRPQSADATWPLRVPA